jgi:LmbE family N-acetylglucosaminyl deacetylase
MKKMCVWILSFLTAFSFILPQSAWAKDEIKSASASVELWNALKPLSTTLRFMNTGAHPDDERSDLLAYLSRGLGIRTTSMIANRGEGGQNEIGTELGNGLGIIRSREMMEASKMSGVQVFHLSEKPDDEIYDFGFSKSKEETLSKWGEEVTYERFIRLLREQRPDIVMPSFLDVDTEHGHHRTINMLTLKAFEDAANPNIFPEQIKEGLTPWQIKKLYLPAKQDYATLSFDIGLYNEKYGMTYPQLGEQSRYLHKSQGMGKDIPAESKMVHLKLEKAFHTDPGKEESLFQDLPYNLKEYGEQLRHIPHLAVSLIRLQQYLDQLIHLYPNHEDIQDKVPHTLKQLRTTVSLVKGSKLNEEQKRDLLERLAIKGEQLMDVMNIASQLAMQMEIDQPILTQGGTVKVKVSVQNKGGEIVRDAKLSLDVPEEWKVSKEAGKKVLKQNELFEHVFTVHVPRDAAYHQPYQPELITAAFHYEAGGQAFIMTGKPQQTLAVLPEVSLQLKNDSMVLNTKALKDQYTIDVTARSHQASPAAAKVSLQVPDGWTVENNEASIQFHQLLEEKTITFKVKPPRDIKEGNNVIKAVASINGKLLSTSVQTIQYDHIGTDYNLDEAVVNVVAFPLEFSKNLKIGYVDSGFDSVSDQLRAIGMTITNLSQHDLQAGDLSHYDTIVLGIRAYLSRDDLLGSNSRLLQYVEQGGHLVVQYHKPNDHWDAAINPPYELTIGSPSIKVRVTDENAKVQVFNPGHPLFNEPNHIMESDWENWVQERGLYFPSHWDSHYQTLVRMADPGEEPFDSGILLARYGKGSYLYTNLVWYRQIQGQVPGGYRIFTNMLHYRSH